MQYMLIWGGGLIELGTSCMISIVPNVNTGIELGYNLLPGGTIGGTLQWHFFAYIFFGPGLLAVPPTPRAAGPAFSE